MKKSLVSEGFGLGKNFPLYYLTTINLFNYLDRYILVALLPTIQKELLLTDTQVGMMASAFMLSYFITSPLFGWFGDRGNRFRWMSLGIAVWSIATAATGLMKQFFSLIFMRFFVGVGEAAYGSISPAVLSDYYPKERRGRAFAVFFMAIPVGSAMGYLLGGVLEGLIGWRLALCAVGLPGLGLALGLLFLKEPKRGAQESTDEQFVAEKSLKNVLVPLARNVPYVLTVAGYCAYTFVLGGIAVWIPHFMERYHQMPSTKGNMLFGAVTVIAGFGGTFLGGALADRWAKSTPDSNLRLSAYTLFLAVPTYLLVMESKGMALFIGSVFLLEFLLFMSTSPINAEIVNRVPPSMRALASALAIFFIHLLGDAISPTLIGYISEATNLYTAMYLFIFVLFLSAVFWSLKPLFFWDAVPLAEEFKLPKSQCHRGYYGEGVRENSLEAFERAVENGSQMLEMDIRLSKDNVPIVIHDDSLERTYGHKGLVKNLSYVELQKLGVPSLSDVLRSEKIRQAYLNIEIKSTVLFSSKLERAIYSVVIKNQQSLNRILFSSFNPISLWKMKKYLPLVPRALIVSDEEASWNKWYLKTAFLGFLACPSLLHLNQGSFISQREKWKKREIPMGVWTVTDQGKAGEFLKLGAVSIISPIPRIV
ncbi:MAG: MFS transporter [Oligoflexia bacterium]|nr:MFS transporter [Oligoflexia bacterium]